MTVEGTDGRAQHEDAPTRGFLFADIRGYTEYLERHGASATAELLARYRAIVRRAIAEHRGAEIRTEGDSFYVVLPSASSAVRCALSIIEATEAENARQPAHAIRVGIGVHAGEAIDTEEGLVGSAVNIAARLSAIAKPGEILVTETVRTLTRSVVQARYLPRGRHRLKGVAEQQEIFAAVPLAGAGTAIQARRVSAPVGIVLAVAGLAVTVAFVYAAVSAATPTPTPSPSALAAAGPSTPGPSITELAPSLSAPPLSSPTPTAGPSIIHIDLTQFRPPGGYRLFTPGAYRFDSFRPVVVFEIDPTWLDRWWYPVLAGSDFTWLNAVRAGTDTTFDEGAAVRPGLLLFNFVRLQTVIGNPCNPGDTASYQLLGGRPQDVVDWLSKQQFLSATNIQPATVAGWTGVSIDVTVKGDPGVACSGSTLPHQGSVGVFKTIPNPLGYGGLFKLHDGDQDRFVVLDIGEATPLVFVSQCHLSDCPNVLPWAQDLMATMTSPPE